MQKDIRRLDVAMDNPCPVGLFEGGSGLNQPLHQFMRRNAAAVGMRFGFEIAPTEQFHHHVRRVVDGFVFDVENFYYMA
jgi:hypothetical protein